MLDGSPRTARGSAFRTGSTGLPRDLNRVAVLRLDRGLRADRAHAHRAAARPQPGDGDVGHARAARPRSRDPRGRPGSVERRPAGHPARARRGAATAFGVKVAPDHLVGVLVDLDAEVLERFERDFDADRGRAPSSGSATSCATGSLDAPPHAPLLGLGLGDAGRRRRRAPRRSSSPMLGWEDLPLNTVLADRLGLPGPRRQRRQHARRLGAPLRPRTRRRQLHHRHDRTRRRPRDRRRRRHLPRVRRRRGRVRARVGGRRRPALLLRQARLPRGRRRRSRHSSPRRGGRT